MSNSEWGIFASRIKTACNDLETKDKEVAKIDVEIETQMELLGCTAVEDKLQDGVHETVAALRAASITVTMITGDKRETAVNIARSCKLVNSENNVYTMSTQDNMYGGGNFIHLNSLAQLVGDGRADPLWGMTTEGHDAIPKDKSRMGRASTGTVAQLSALRKDSLPEEERPGLGLAAIAVEEGDAIGVSLSPLASHTRLGITHSTSHHPISREESVRDSLPPPALSRAVSRSGGSPKFCIVLDGAALSILLSNPSQTKKLLSVMAHPQCEAAIFCRVNPKQKGLIVKSCRDNLRNGCVLAIGDGANDISMIKEAHVGIGIFGEEGWQAAGSADYAITKFKDLYRLLFLHGRWNYQRVTFFICFFMYKNYAFTFLQFWMATLSQWSGVTVLDSICLLAFNSVFMVAPMFIAGLFDKDVHPDYDRPDGISEEKWHIRIIPKLYKTGQENVMFKSSRVIGWLLMGLIHSVMVFFIVFGPWNFDGNTAIRTDGFNASFTMDQQAMYTVLLMMLILVHALLVQEWNTGYAICAIGFHVILYVIFTVAYDSLFLQPYSYIMGATFTNWSFWFILLIGLTISILPLVIGKYALKVVRPSAVDALVRSKYRKSPNHDHPDQVNP
jgi:magnesium-transporting ATPase (P-type)